MSQPTVCVVMLVNGREAMTRRAIASFRAQTYERKRLVVVNSGDAQITTDAMRGEFTGIYAGPQVTIGVLRNAGNQLAVQKFDPSFIAHMDSDDWSHPRRLEEQVALLEASGKQCVGYREMLFWDTRFRNRHNEAWLYCNPGRGLCAGGTIMYRRELWERCPFPDAPHEDRRWWSDNQAVSAGYLDASAMAMEGPDGPLPLWGPRFIAHIHGGNSETIPRSTMLAGGGVWKRAPEFDSYCAERMKL